MKSVFFLITSGKEFRVSKFEFLECVKTCCPIDEDASQFISSSVEVKRNGGIESTEMYTIYKMDFQKIDEYNNNNK